MEISVSIKAFQEFKLEELYSLLQLRARVYVVEQECPYNDLDGGDFDATHFLYQEKDGKVRGALRVYQKEGTTWVGRVVVDKALRRSGVGRQLMQKAHAWIEMKKLPRPVVLNSQIRYSDFYASLGYVRQPGTENFEDGIPHIQMQLA